ncbi:MAG: putative bifunctional diguanylate cyclase/phosphodiesterase [Nocardioides sp.]
MRRRPGTGTSTARLMLTHGLLILVSVGLLGIALSLGIQGTASERGLAEARTESLLVAQTAVEPHLSGRPLDEGLTERERAVMQRLVQRAVTGGHLLRLRLRDELGHIVYADDGPSDVGRSKSTLGKSTSDDEAADDEVSEATDGEVVAQLTHLNADREDGGTLGPAAVEVYLPLVAGSPGRQIGVLEMYLPYAPIKAAVDHDLRVLYRDLGLGLAGLFVVLFVIAVSVSRGLRRALAASAWSARHDALTGLPNRALFVESIAAAGAWASRTGRPGAVAIIDLDHFKDLNDTLGHSIGDELLTILADRLSAAVPAPDMVARLGGDEFGLVLRDGHDAAKELARIAEILVAEAQVGALPLSAAPSIGYLAITGTDVSAETLMQRAEVAMYAAKAGHTVIAEYSADLERFVAADMELIAEVPRALRAGEFRLHYQPQCDAATGALVGLEALVRWQHPRLGLLAPGRFIPMAEQTDLIERLTAWVLEAALADAARLADRGRPIPIAVNVSARSVVRTDFARQAMAALELADVAPSQLVIEVTETTLVSNPERARSVLAELDSVGVHVSIDDFGQGQTSLAYLADLPIRELKVDRAFVTGMAADPARTAIVRSVIDLGHSLGMRVVAEGIETDQDLEAVRALDCDVAQGYHLARPMDFDALVELIDRSAAPSPTA